jgi:resuscitation-promoting factor RpfA
MQPLAMVQVAVRATTVLALLATAWLGAATALLGWGRALLRPLADGPAAGDRLVAGVAGGAAAAATLLVVTWFALSLGCAVAATARDRLATVRRPRPRRAGAARLLRPPRQPLAVRRLAALLLGVGVAAAPATALWVPAASADLSAADRPVAATSVDRPAPAGPAVLRVRVGNSLCAIAARRLGADPPDAAVARAWPRWYRANRARIGPDPDLLVPGQLLHPPTIQETR